MFKQSSQLQLVSWSSDLFSVSEGAPDYQLIDRLIVVLFVIL